MTVCLFRGNSAGATYQRNNTCSRSAAGLGGTGGLNAARSQNMTGGQDGITAEDYTDPGL